MCVCLPRGVLKEMHGTVIHSGQKRGTAASMSCGRMGYLVKVYEHNGMLHSNENEQSPNVDDVGEFQRYSKHLVKTMYVLCNLLATKRKIESVILNVKSNSSPVESGQVYKGISLSAGCLLS